MLKQYASYFASYLLNNLKNIRNIKRIVLYGSVAKDEATKKSDIDIFIETNKKSKNLEKEIKNLENKFYNSREASLFKLRNTQNKFSIKTGDLRKWKDLHKSIASTGIILYSPYETKETPSGLNHKIIFFWEKTEKNRGAFLNKIYGFKIKNKYYKGLLEKCNGKKTGKSSIMVPIAYKNDFLRLIKQHKVHAKAIEVFV